MKNGLSSRRQSAIALVAIAAMVLLLIFAGTLRWRGGSPTTGQQESHGPLAKTSRWVEPPVLPIIASGQTRIYPLTRYTFVVQQAELVDIRAHVTRDLATGRVVELIPSRGNPIAITVVSGDKPVYPSKD